MQFVSKKIVKNKRFSNYRQIVMPYILAHLYMGFNSHPKYNSTIKTNWSVLLSSPRKQEQFVNRVWIDTRLYIFICCFGLVSSRITWCKNIYKGKTLTSQYKGWTNRTSLNLIWRWIYIWIYAHRKINPIKYDNVVNIWIEFAG